jgi:hypothetical protein
MTSEKWSGWNLEKLAGTRFADQLLAASADFWLDLRPPDALVRVVFPADELLAFALRPPVARRREDGVAVPLSGTVSGVGVSTVATSVGVSAVMDSDAAFLPLLARVGES